MARVTGTPVRRISEDWIYGLKRKYFPEVKDRMTLALAGEELAGSQGVNLKPVAVPDSTLLGGCRYFFISARSGYTNIYSASWRGREQDVRSVVRGQRAAQFESFHPFQSRIDVSKKGELCFVSKWNQRDALFIYDIKEKRVLIWEYLDDLISLTSPSWNRDGTKIALAGLKPSGMMDLYVFNRETKELTRLTNDFYTDLDPTWSPDGKQIAFASDRTRFGADGHNNLFLIDVETLGIRYLTCGPWTDQTPSWSPDGKRIAFASDRDGQFDLYGTDLSGTGGRFKRLLGSAMDPSWLPGGKGLLFTGFRRGGFGIYQMAAADSLVDPFTLTTEEAPTPWRWEDTLARSTQTPAPYEPRYGLDLVQGGIAVEPTENVGEGLQGAVSDLLGNRLFYFQLGDTALWFPTDARDGARYNLTAALTTTWSSYRTENVMVSADLRRYLRTSQWTTIALRLQGRVSSGADPQRFAMGGSYSLRGYGRRSIYGTRMYLANAEYPLPLFDPLVPGIPALEPACSQRAGLARAPDSS